MYNIPYFKANNHQQVIDFMQANPFVTICGVDSKGLPVATHIPVLMKVENDVVTISGHIMRKQDHSNAFEINKNVLVIFSAPSAFVSANWYTTKNMGSTWNYQTVHARGQLEIKDETHLRNLLTDLTLHFENLLPDEAGSTQTNPNLNSITLTGFTLSDFGASSLSELNAQIVAGTSAHFQTGSVSDVFGDHGYLLLS